MIITSLRQIIIVRYARKPIWMPTAPSKLFRIPEHKFYTEDEIIQITKLTRAYRAQMESIKMFMEEEFFVPAGKSGGLPNEFIDRELEEDKKIYALNETKNKEVAAMREQFISKQMKELEKRVLDKKIEMEDYLLKRAIEVDEYIQTQKADPLRAVTKDNIDIAIEEAIKNPVFFEYCIDKRGKRIGISSRTTSKQSMRVNKDS